MRGPERFLLDMASQPKFAAALLDIITELKMHYWERALEAVGPTVLIASEADDLVAERGPLISMEMYRQHIAPRHRRLFEFIKRKAQSRAYVLYHSCGAVQEFIPSLIEEGIDILGPVQAGAGGMDAGELKRRFGRDLTFWGGGVDTRGHVCRTAPRPRSPTRSGAGSTTWHRAAASSSARPTTCGPTSRPRTTWPCGRRCRSTAPTEAGRASARRRVPYQDS